ncbi:sodium-dependent dicarboxylate transporter 2/3/5 [Pontibacter ummariensis]|uniref:Solute carrier family 13 (Sodium-dependent dicarboxylate transporter), member 2/3/5 n=1 Tax=Pontibacter ummariensis TaxID=1610492 RepID=A0A239D5Y9_9BACT|nr:DASS family sodium-coupled anion symporter [Pontibacter ummariensis]PRY14244.1 sodium-dependent dicarboxylate transporter 2/3/5 [Pontibacter ummariensis]SNS27254.1 solute carrier family 13 (sodium-dependent dicarboxylate transporter), member 2/3/5 [Pontibacter ummariensis]
MHLTRRNTGLLLAPLLALLVWLLTPMLDYEARLVAAIMVFCLVFWMTEVIPLSMTAFLGVLAAVVLGIAEIETAFLNLGHPIILLFIGSFLLARSMTRHGLDKRIALFILSRSFFQQSLFRLFLGFSFISFLLSMWVSNSVTVAMLLPLTLGVTQLVSQPEEGEGAAVYFLLGIAYSASIGGISTIIGSPPNLIGVNYLAQQGIEIDFLQWMFLALPISLSMYGFLLLYMRYCLGKSAYSKQVVQAYVAKHLQQRKKLRKGELVTMGVFILAVTLWLAPGVFNLLGMQAAYAFMDTFFAESTVALLAALLLFLIPAGHENEGNGTLVAEDLVKIDWDTILLFGGGMALGQLVVSSGLADVIGRSITTFVDPAQRALLVLLLVFLVLMLTEISSNTAIAITFVPIIIGVLDGLNLPLLYPVLGVVVACSMAFMLPVATPPNAIVYGSKQVPISQMVRTGLVLNLVATAVITAWVLLYML